MSYLNSSVQKVMADVFRAFLGAPFDKIPFPCSKSESKQLFLRHALQLRNCGKVEEFNAFFDALHSTELFLRRFPLLPPVIEAATVLETSL